MVSSLRLGSGQDLVFFSVLVNKPERSIIFEINMCHDQRFHCLVALLVA